MDEKDSDKNYIEILSALQKNLFRDFLSELSRKRQLSLLLTAVITILISFTLITPIETTLGGIKFSFTNIQILPILSGAISLYFLLLYIAGIFQDWEYAQHTEIPMQYEYALAIRKLQDDLDSQSTDLARISVEMARQMLDTYKASREAQNKVEQFRKKTLLATSEMKKQGKSDDEIIKFITESKKEVDEAMSRYTAYTETEKIRSESMGQKMENDIDNGTILQEKVKLLVKTYNRYLLWRNIVIAIEIIFPVCIGIISVCTAIWAIL